MSGSALKYIEYAQLTVVEGIADVSNMWGWTLLEVREMDRLTEVTDEVHVGEDQYGNTKPNALVQKQKVLRIPVFLFGRNEQTVLEELKQAVDTAVSEKNNAETHRDELVKANQKLTDEVAEKITEITQLELQREADAATHNKVIEMQEEETEKAKKLKKAAEDMVERVRQWVGEKEWGEIDWLWPDGEKIKKHDSKGEVII